MTAQGRRDAPGRITVLAPAKINLGLEILGRRRDGYHEIVTVLQALRLTDRLEIRLSEEPGIRLHLRPAGLDLGPAEDNLAVRAARLIPARRSQPPGVEIALEKRIPVGSGLGGGSADAAAVLLGLAELRRGSCRPEVLEELGTTLGSDVPFFVRGGTQLGFGRGERLRAAPPWPFHHLVLVYPNLGISTGSIYTRATLQLTSPGILGRIQSRGFSPDFWSRQGPDLRNDLEHAVLEAEPRVGAVLAELRSLGSPFARVTGSGSAVFGLSPDSRTAMTWAEHFLHQGYWARAVRPSRGGCCIRGQRPGASASQGE